MSLAATEQLHFPELGDYEPLPPPPPRPIDALGSVLGLVLIGISWLPILLLIWTLT
jgi:hypothetical protein